MLRKSVDWCPYDNGLCHERVNRASLRLIYWISHFMSDNLWQNYLNSTNLSDRSQCASDILTDSFSTETKQTYDSPTRIFFYIFKSLIDWSWEKTDISISVKLHEFQQWNTISENAIYRMHLTYFLDASDIFFRFIHIFKHISQKRLWYGFLLALKKSLKSQGICEKTNVRPTVKNNSKQTLCKHPVKQRTNNLQLFKCIKYDN